MRAILVAVTFVLMGVVAAIASMDRAETVSCSDCDVTFETRDDLYRCPECGHPAP